MLMPPYVAVATRAVAVARLFWSTVLWARGARGWVHCDMQRDAVVPVRQGRKDGRVDMRSGAQQPVAVDVGQGGREELCGAWWR